MQLINERRTEMIQYDCINLYHDVFDVVETWKILEIQPVLIASDQAALPLPGACWQLPSDANGQLSSPCDRYSKDQRKAFLTSVKVDTVIVRCQHPRPRACPSEAMITHRV